MPSANGCRTQVPWMGDIVVTYRSFAGLGWRKRKLRILMLWWLELSSVELQSRTIATVFIRSDFVALEKDLLLPYVFPSITCCGLESARPNCCFCIRTSWLGRWFQITLNAKNCRSCMPAVVLVSSWGNWAWIQYVEKYNVSAIGCHRRRWEVAATYGELSVQDLN